MAENQEDRSSEDLTEEASPYRLEEYRRKGMVAQSKEVTGLLALMAAAVMTYMMAPKMGAQMLEFMREVFRTDLSSRIDLGGEHVLQETWSKALKIMMVVALPICGAGFLLGILGSVAQIGSLFTTEPLTPDLNRIDPINGLKKMFAMSHLLDGLKMVVKITVVVLVSYSVVKTQILSAPAQSLGEAGGTLVAYGQIGKSVFLSLFLVMAIFAAIDYGFQRWEFMKQVRMTKQEAKQEFKEREGDPQIKARIRAVQREVARKRMMAAVKKADVIVTNPTHIAIALVYDKEKMAAPKVVAKGADFLAQRIKKVAADAGVPLVENVPLARTLYKTVKVGQAIPRQLYQAVAEVLAYVYRLKNRGF